LKIQHQRVTKTVVDITIYWLEANSQKGDPNSCCGAASEHLHKG